MVFTQPCIDDEEDVVDSEIYHDWIHSLTDEEYKEYIQRLETLTNGHN